MRGLPGVDARFRFDGAFRFEAQELGTYQLAAVTAGGFLPFAPSWGQSPLTFTARAGHQVDGIVIALEPEKIILGKVIDPDGTPVASVAVTLLVPAGETMELVSLPSRQRTDAHGVFRFSAPIGTLIEAEHPEFDPLQQRFTSQDWTRGELTLRLVRLSSKPPRLSISGRVVDADGADMPDVPVTARRGDHDPFADERAWWATRSDADGRFEVTGLGTGKYTLAAASPGMVSAQVEGVAAGSKDVLLRLHQAGGSIAGRVVSDADSKAVASFAVVISVRAGKIEETPVQTRSFIDPEGRFLVGPLAPKEYLVRVVANGYAPSNPRALDVITGKTVDTEVRLSKGGTLIGNVANASTGAPVGGARIAAEGQVVGEGVPIPIETVALSGADGHFELSGIASGTRSVSTSAKGYHARALSGIQIVEGTTVGPIEIRLTPLESADVEPKTEITGIGAQLAPQGDVLVVGKVLEGGGAAEAGLMPGDFVLAIDGRPVGEFDFNGVIQRIRGPEGTSVVLNVRRKNGQEQTMVVFRRLVRG